MEYMTPSERIEAAIELRKPDRVPLAPDFSFYSATFAGITQNELLFDFNKGETAFERTYEHFRWDGTHLFVGGSGPFWPLLYPMEYKMPGVDGYGENEIMQSIEREEVGPEIYEEICRKGFNPVYSRLIKKYMPRFHGGKGLIQIFHSLLPYLVRIRRHLRRWHARGVPCISGAMPGTLAFDILSGLRSVAPFCMDLHRYPDLVLRALTVVHRFYVETMVWQTKAAGLRYSPICLIGSCRPSATFISPKQFERFGLPLLTEACGRLLEEGITPLLHLDSDWTPMLAYLKELPGRKCIVEFDGTTDVFKAKEVLGDHLCIMGDVPAALLTLGSPEEMDAYCERLIKEMGAEGGFILSSGCSMPPDSKKENVEAMCESVRKYRP